jgi:ABC-type glycerol-3-phosphate transport system permease component
MAEQRTAMSSQLAPSPSHCQGTFGPQAASAIYTPFSKVLCFTLCWNEFTYALTFISQSANKTAVVGVTSDLIRGDIYFWGSLMAGALLASIPIVIVYVLFLDYYVSGLTAGAVKG